MSCDTLCDKRNKFYDLCDGPKLKLEIIVDESVLFTVTNIGTDPVCNDIFICSSQFGKIKIENKLLIPGESLSITKEFSDVILTRRYCSKKCEKNESSQRRTATRAYAKIGNRKFIFSNKLEEPLLGVVFSNLVSLFGAPEPDTFAFLITIGNSYVSTMPAYNVKFTIPFTADFTRSIVSDPVIANPDNGRIWIDSLGIHVIAYEIPIGSQETFRINFLVPPPTQDRVYKIYSVVQTDSPVLLEETRILNAMVRG